MTFYKSLIAGVATVAMAGAVSIAYGQNYSPRQPAAGVPSEGNNEAAGAPQGDGRTSVPGGRWEKSSTLSAGYPSVPSSGMNEATGSPTMEDMTYARTGARTGNNHIPNPTPPSAGQNEGSGSLRNERK